jgi:hypothetical protein
LRSFRFIFVYLGLTEKGNGYWKINNSILKEEEYKKIINNLIDSYLNTKKTIDIRLLWDTFKIEIREITSVYCRNKAKSTRENLNLSFSSILCSILVFNI